MLRKKTAGRKNVDTAARSASGSSPPERMSDADFRRQFPTLLRHRLVGEIRRELPHIDLPPERAADILIRQLARKVRARQGDRLTFEVALEIRPDSECVVIFEGVRTIKPIDGAVALVGIVWRRDVLGRRVRCRVFHRFIGKTFFQYVGLTGGR